MNKPFIKVDLRSGIGETLVVYYECDTYDTVIKEVTDSDILTYEDEIIEWANTCGLFTKEDAQSDFRYDHPSTLSVVYLNENQIKYLYNTGHIFSKSDLLNL